MTMLQRMEAALLLIQDAQRQAGQGGDSATYLRLGRMAENLTRMVANERGGNGTLGYWSENLKKWVTVPEDK